MQFGSTISKTTPAESDLDLAFYPNENIDEEKLYQDLIIFFKRADIDLINLKNTNNHLLRYEILSKGKILYEHNLGTKSTMEWQSFIDYTDFKKYYAMRSVILDKKIAEMLN